MKTPLYRRRAFIGIAVAALWLLIQLLESRAAHESKLASVSALSRNAIGTSALHEWMDERDEETAIRRAPILHDSDIVTPAYAILAPRAPLSDREVRQLTAAVEGGKKLIVSFHDPLTYASVAKLLKKLKVESPHVEWPAFANRKSVSVTATEDQDWFLKGETYTFYSAWKLDTRSCITRPLSCYYSLHRVGKGEVALFVGIPFFANALIGKQDNAGAAARLTAWSGGITFDEYHHFFSDRTWRELIAMPSFSVPLVGISLLLFLYFLSGHTPFHYRHLTAVRAPARSYHDWNEGIVAASLTKQSLPEAVEFHRRCLDRIFKRAGATSPAPPGSDETSLQRATNLIRSHQSLLHSKRKVKTT